VDTHVLPFRDLAYVVIAAITGGLVAWRLRQPVIIGYVLAGILISPLTPGPSVSDAHSLELFAEIGVVLLMFSVGLEFSLRELLKAKWVAFIGGPLGISLSILLGMGTGHLLGWSAAQGIVLGAVTSVASTMVLTRLLIDGVTVVSLKRASGESLTNPPAETVFQPGDRLRVLGRSDEIDRFALHAAEQSSSTASN
jgi:predicted Kef-type K+ transport protein